MSERFKGLDILDESPEIMHLSVRSRNCLEKAGINTIRELITRSEQELLKIKNFGKTCLCEIENKLRAINLSLGMKDPEITAKSSEEKIFTNHNPSKLGLMPIEELDLSVRSFNALHKARIRTLGQLLEKSDSQLLGIQNFGKTCLKEITEKLASMGLSRDPTQISIDNDFLASDLKIREEFITHLPTNLKRLKLSHLFSGAQLQAISEYLNGNTQIDVETFLVQENASHALARTDLSTLISILSLIKRFSVDLKFEDPKNLITYISSIAGKRDYQIYIKRKKDGQTLEGIANELGITRERVRQIEASVGRKIKRSILGEGLLAYMRKWLDFLEEKGGISRFTEAQETLADNIDADDFQVLCSCLSDLYESPIYFFQDDNHSILSLYKQSEIEDAYRSLLSEVTAYVGQTRDELRESLSADIKYNQAIEDYCLDKFISNKAFVKDGKVIGVKGKHITNVEATFLVTGKEMHFEEAESKYKELFNEEISFRGMLDRSENIVLWGRGTYIHCDLIDVNLEPLQKIYDFINSTIHNLERKTAATAVFDSNQALMAFMGIPTPQALYSILRMHDDHRFLYRKYPDIEHTDNADASRKERDDELNEFFLSAKRPLYKDELVDYFVKKRGMREYQIFFAMDRCPDIYRMGGSCYVHSAHLGLDKKKIMKIIQDVEGLLTKTDPLILGKAIHEMNLPDLGQYHWSRQLLSSVVKKNSNLKAIYHAAVTRENNSSINTVEDLILHLVKTSPIQFSKQALIAFLRLNKITTNLMTVDKFIEKYGFLLVK